MVMIHTEDELLMPNFSASTGKATFTSVTSSTVITSTICNAMTAMYFRYEKPMPVMILSTMIVNHHI